MTMLQFPQTSQEYVDKGKKLGPDIQSSKQLLQSDHLFPELFYINMDLVSLFH